MMQPASRWPVTIRLACIGDASGMKMVVPSRNPVLLEFRNGTVLLCVALSRYITCLKTVKTSARQRQIQSIR